MRKIKSLVYGTRIINERELERESSNFFVREKEENKRGSQGGISTSNKI